MQNVKDHNNQRLPNAKHFLDSEILAHATQVFSAKPVRITDLSTGWQWSAGVNNQRAYPVPLVIAPAVASRKG